MLVVTKVVILSIENRNDSTCSLRHIMGCGSATRNQIYVNSFTEPHPSDHVCGMANGTGVPDGEQRSLTLLSHVHVQSIDVAICTIKSQP